MACCFACFCNNFYLDQSNYTGIEFQGVNIYPEAPQLVRVGIFLLACVIFYFFPLLRTHYHARKAEIKWLTILSKVLIIHFYCVLGITAIFVIVSIFQLL